MNNRDEKLRPYLMALPDIIRYQLVTKLLLGVWLFALGRLFRVLLRSAGRVAVTSGDFAFLFTTWQGILILVIALVTLAVYVALDLAAMIVLSRNLLLGRKMSVWRSCLTAMAYAPRLLSVKGIAVLIYIVLIAPIVGVGFSITLTKGFYIPTFISSVIADTPLYLIAVSAAVIVFISVGVANLFILHGMFLDRMNVKEAGEQSRELMSRNWKDFIRQNILFIAVMAVVLAVIVIVALVVPLLITDLLPIPDGARRVMLIYFMIQGSVISAIADLVAMPIYMMKMTQLYYTYRDGTTLRYHGNSNRVHKLEKIAAVIEVAAVIALAVFLNRDFDRFFPQKTEVGIIAHRAGGIEAPENTVAGIEKAAQTAAFGCEIDIQRTKDGYYIVNHDGNFSRVAGDSRKPEEMTLEEVRKLSVSGEPVATFEEMLDACKGRLTLFVELKGETADRQMVDDAVRIIKERGMTGEAAIICLKYDLIDYLEKQYPEIDSGFLAFASFGDTYKLNCDYLALEEEAATYDTIASIHRQGKKVLVWTVNKIGSQQHFMCSGVDAIITDTITQATEVREQINGRTDLDRIIDRIKQLIS